jgi:hypothetical protein
MRAILICCLLFWTSSQAADLPQQQMFNKANELFKQKQYSEAAGAYQQLIDEGYKQPELYTNAGNAWYKANRTGMAIYSYEKALLRDPFYKPAKHNLAVANQRVEGYVNDLPLLFFQQWWLHIQYLFSPNGWAAGSIILFWIVIGGIIFMLLKPGFKTTLVKSAVIAFGVFFILFIGMAGASYASADTSDNGIIMNPVVKVKAGPDAGSKDAFELHEGIKVQVVDATKEYCKIMLPDGKTGWLACGEIKRL